MSKGCQSVSQTDRKIYRAPGRQCDRMADSRAAKEPALVYDINYEWPLTHHGVIFRDESHNFVYSPPAHHAPNYVRQPLTDWQLVLRIATCCQYLSDLCLFVLVGQPRDEVSATRLVSFRKLVSCLLTAKWDCIW